MAAGPYYSSLLFKKVNPFADEIDDPLQKLQNIAFLTCLGLTQCLIWNCGSVAFVWMVGGVETKILFLALAYLVCGLPAANWLWFRPLRQALRTENTSMFRYFFLFYQLHIAFCMFAAVSPPIIAKGRSLTGIMSASDISGDYGEIGYLYFIGFGWFSLESMLSIWVLHKVYKFYRHGGLALEMV